MRGARKPEVIYRPGKTAEDRLPAAQRPRVHRANDERGYAAEPDNKSTAALAARQRQYDNTKDASRPDRKRPGSQRAHKNRSNP